MNARLDGYLIHPLDLFPKNKEVGKSYDKISINTAELDGFNVHPLDQFLSKDKNKNNLTNFDVYNNKDNNKLDVFSFRNSDNTNKIFNQIQNNGNYNLYEPKIQYNNFTKNEISLNAYNTATNMREYQKYFPLDTSQFSNPKIPYDNYQQADSTIYTIPNTQNINYINEDPVSQNNIITLPPVSIYNYESKIKYNNNNLNLNNIIYNTTSSYQDYSKLKNNIKYTEPYTKEIKLDQTNKPINNDILYQLISSTDNSYIIPQTQASIINTGYNPTSTNVQTSNISYYKSGIETYEYLNQNLNPNINQNINPNINQNINQNINPNINQNISPNINQNINPNIDQNINPNIDQNINPNIDQNINPNINQNINPNINQNINPNINQNINPNINQNINPNIIQNVKPLMKIIKNDNNLRNINQYNNSKIMNLTMNKNQLNNLFEVNTNPINNNEIYNTDINKLNIIKSTPNISKTIPYDTNSYEPDPIYGDYQTRTNIKTIKTFFNSSLRTPTRRKNPIKAYSIPKNHYLHNTKIYIPTQKSNISPINKSIITPKRTKVIYPNIKTITFKTPIKYQKSIVASHIIPNIQSINYTPIKTQKSIVTNQVIPNVQSINYRTPIRNQKSVVASQIIPNIITTTKIVKGNNINILPIPLNTSMVPMDNFTNSNIGRSLSPINITPIRKNRVDIILLPNKKRNISIEVPTYTNNIKRVNQSLIGNSVSPFKYNLVSYQNKYNFIQPKLKTIRLGNSIYNVNNYRYLK